MQSKKEVLNNDLIGEGEKISPNFLMNKVFELAGYDGNEFMDASNELKSEFSVINSNFCVINDQIVRNLSDDENYKLNEFVDLIKDNSNVIFIDKDINKLEDSIKKLQNIESVKVNDFSDWFIDIADIIKKG